MWHISRSRENLYNTSFESFLPCKNPQLTVVQGYCVNNLYSNCYTCRIFNNKEQRTEHRVQPHSIYSTVGKPIAKMFTKTSVFTYYNITIKQSANKSGIYN